MTNDGRCRGGALLLAALFCVGMVGCASQHDEALRLGEELGRARADAAWQQARAAELESRVSRLEQRATEATRVRSAQDDRVVRRLDRLIEMNESLLASRIAAPLPNAALATAPLSDGATSAPPQPKPSKITASSAPSSRLMSTASVSDAPAPTPEQQLRTLVERLRGRPGRLHGTLTREQEDALRVLLRTERTLDADNPYPPSFY